MPNFILAKELLDKAGKQCLLAAQLADRHAAYVSRLDGEVATARAYLTLNAADPVVKDRIAQVDFTLAEAQAQADAQVYIAAAAKFDEALQQIEVIQAARARAIEIKTTLSLLQPKVTALTTATPRAQALHIGSDLDTLDKTIVEIDTALKTALGDLDLDAVDKKLVQATAQCQVLTTRSLLKTNGANPGAVKTQLKALNDLPGGAALLDEFVKGLSRKDDPKHMLLALEVRFNLSDGGAVDEKENDPTKKAGMRELQRIYALMADVPDKHTRDNPSLKKVTRKPGGGSAYGGKNMTLGDGPSTIGLPRSVVCPDPDHPPPHCLGNPQELPDVLPECKLDPTATPPKFFDWNAQHEIAHALDDRKNFMSTRAGDEKFGGWQDHGGNVLAVTQAVAAEFARKDIDAVVIAKYLDDGTVPAGPPAGWASVKAWADAVREDQEPWGMGALCAKSVTDGGLSAGGRVYHEAYPSHWVSYSDAARKQGITGYQFRTSGEWFSELYAAYKSKVLKPSHPANEWLNKLFGQKATV